MQVADYDCLVKKTSPHPPFAQALLAWYKAYGRDLPWRQTQDPYRIWLSEVILQQTRIAQGLPYYEKFVSQYPSLALLASAPEDDVLRLWQGLGYYSRARNMLKTARHLVGHNQGQFPDRYAELIKLPGIGPYTAAAIASFAFGEDVAVLDGNVFRVLSRYYGVDTDILSTAGKKQFAELAALSLAQGESSAYNSAIMDLGSLICSPGMPNCLVCPVRLGCQAAETGRQLELPVKAPKQKPKDRYLVYWVLQNAQGQIWVKRRTEKGIWAGLYEFYLAYDSEQAPTETQLTQQLAHILGEEARYSTHWEGRHQLSHQNLHIQIRQIEGADLSSFQAKDSLWVSADALEGLGKPIVLTKYFEGRSWD